MLQNGKEIIDGKLVQLILILKVPFRHVAKITGGQCFVWLNRPHALLVFSVAPLINEDQVVFWCEMI